jgi:hypothetical protein
MDRPPGGRSPPKRAAVIGIKLKPAHKSGYVFINHKQIALLLAASLIQSCFFKAQLLNSSIKLNRFLNSTPVRGSAPGPMQGEVSPYDPLFSAHPALSSQRQSLCGTQNNPPRSDLLKHPYFLYRSGARFCSKGRRITLLSGAARIPIKRKSEQPHFKSGGVRETK